MRKLRRLNVAAVPFLAIEAVATVALLLHLRPSFLVENWIVTLVTAGLASGRGLLSLLQTVVQRKTSIDELKDDAVIGRYAKGDLLALVRETLARLGLAEGVRVYLLRDKEMNACSIHIALSPFPALQAVYLNRAVLHVLEPDELRNVLGHELGHNHRYDITWSRYLLLHLVFAGALALALVQAIGVGEGMSLIVVAFVMGIWEWFLWLPRRRMGQGIELLCDDLGAGLAGPLPAIRELLKTGLEMEARARLMREALVLGRKGQPLRVEDAIAAYEEAMPWGTVSPETSDRLLAAIRDRRRKDATFSVSGFLRYVRDEEAAQEQAEILVKQLAAVSRLPLVDRGLLSGLGDSFGEERIRALIERLEAHPEELLFHLAEEVDDRHASHPSFRRRVLYLWRHRDAIAADAQRQGAGFATPVRPV